MKRVAGVALVGLAMFGLTACKNPADADVPGTVEVVKDFEYQMEDGRVIDCLYFEAMEGYDQSSSVTCDWGNAA